MRKRIIPLRRPPSFLSFAAVGGKEERNGPLGAAFDMTSPDDKFGQNTWEKAEGELGRLALNIAMKKAQIRPDDVSCLFAGDLQNQCVASSGGLFSFGIPYIGLYGACSTCTESLLALSVFLSESDSPRIGAAVTTSHNCAAERQFRLPLEYGGQRAPSAQWTATAGGAFLLTGESGDVRIPEVMPGKIVDGEISDASNMGGAMAAAAADTLLSYFGESGRSPSDFDAIVTGDLGKVGSSIVGEMLAEEGYDLQGKYFDCGNLLYEPSAQDVHSGGSGCGCSASVLASHFLPALVRGDLRHVLFLSTGALMSASSVQQGEHIFGIAPLIHLERM